MSFFWPFSLLPTLVVVATLAIYGVKTFIKSSMVNSITLLYELLGSLCRGLDRFLHDILASPFWHAHSPYLKRFLRNLTDQFSIITITHFIKDVFNITAAILFLVQLGGRALWDRILLLFGAPRLETSAPVYPRLPQRMQCSGITQKRRCRNMKTAVDFVDGVYYCPKHTKQRDLDFGRI